MEDIQKVFEEKSDKQLIQIIEHDWHKYTDEAIDIAKNVLQERKLDPNLTQNIKDELNEEYYLTRKAKQKENQSLIYGDLNADILDAPMLSKSKDVRNLKIISGFIFVYFAWSCFRSLPYLFNEFSFLSLWIIVSIGIPLIIAIGLFTIKRFGWIVSVGFTSYNILISVFTTLAGYFLGYDDSLGEIFSNGNNYKTFLFSFLRIFIYVAIQSFLLNYMLKDSVKQLFHINKKNTKVTILVGLGLGLLLSIFSITVNFF